MIPRILFVDDQPEVLDGLRRVLRSTRAIWDLEYCSSGKDALRILDRSTIDLLVTDMRMPGMDGAQLCHEVAIRSPQTIRMILTGQSSSEQIMRAFGVAHRCLAKPCPQELLVQTLKSTLSLRNLIYSPPLSAFLADITALPTMPGVFADLMSELLSDNADMRRVTELVSMDMAVSCRVLQLVNSAFFGLQCRVDSPAHAAQLLGLERLKGLVLTAGVFAKFDSPPPAGINIEALQEQSLQTSLLAGRLMRLEAPNSLLFPNKAVVAGAVHDIGQLVLLQNRPEEYARVLTAAQRNPRQLCDDELLCFGVTHTVLGAYLLSLWGMDADIIEAVAHHHDPCGAESAEFTVLTALHIAEALIQELEPNIQWPFAVTMDLEYLDQLDVSDRLDTWRDLARRSLEGKDR